LKQAGPDMRKKIRIALGPAAASLCT